MKRVGHYCGWLGFLDVDGLGEVLPGFVEDFLKEEVAAGFGSMESLYCWYSQDLSSADHVESAIEALDVHVARLRTGLIDSGLMSVGAQAMIAAKKGRFDGRLNDLKAELDEEEAQRADHDQDEWKERWHDQRYELEHGRFADVDE